MEIQKKVITLVGFFLCIALILLPFQNTLAAKPQQKWSRIVGTFSVGTKFLAKGSIQITTKGSTNVKTVPVVKGKFQTTLVDGKYQVVSFKDENTKLSGKITYSFTVIKGKTQPGILALKAKAPINVTGNIQIESERDINGKLYLVDAGQNKVLSIAVTRGIFSTTLPDGKYNFQSVQTPTLNLQVDKQFVVNGGKTKPLAISLKNQSNTETKGYWISTNRSGDSTVTLYGIVSNPGVQEVEIQVNKDDKFDIERLTPENGRISGTIPLYGGSGKYTLQIKENENVVSSFNVINEDPEPLKRSEYTISTDRTKDGTVTLNGQISDQNVKEIEIWIFKDSEFDIEKLTPKNGRISGTITLSRGTGNYSLVIKEKEQDVASFDVINEDPKAHLKRFEYTLSTDQTKDGYVTVSADLSHLSHPIKKVNITYTNLENNKKDGRYDIPIVDGKMSERFPLVFGEGKYSISVTEMDEDDSGRIIDDFYVTNDYPTDFTVMPTLRIPSNNPEIVTLANQITKGATTDMQKSRAIYDWITHNISYDYDMVLYNSSEMDSGMYQSNTVFKVLQVKAAQCFGYSLLNATLHRAVGIPAKLVGSTLRPGLHEWNEIKIDGNWIIEDTTWGASEDLREIYFNPTPEEFAKTHTKEDEESE